MKSIRSTVFLSLACVVCAAEAAPGLMAPGEGPPQRHALRNAVEAHRAARSDEVRREEAAAGRRLTAAELAELRQQVRQQWTPRAAESPTAQLPSMERELSPPVSERRSLTMPRSQRQ